MSHHRKMPKSSPKKKRRWEALTNKHALKITRALHRDLTQVVPELAEVPTLRNFDHLPWWSEQVQNSVLSVESAYQFGVLRLLREYLRKYQLPGNQVACQNAAIQTVLRCDECCKAINHSDRKFRYVKEVREEICNLLPAVDLCRVWEYSRHGPGASNGSTKRTDKFSKYLCRPYTVTSGAAELSWSLLAYDTRWRRALGVEFNDAPAEAGFLINEPFDGPSFLKICDSNRVVTVPKDNRTDRPIAIEPTLNCYMQLGADGVLRRVLKRRWGINLNDQTRNAYMAGIGHSSGYATIDLSSASDLISTRVVRELLPPDWFSLLYKLRSPLGELPDGTTFIYERFSSMGNGSTFALESLIFAAIARVATRMSGFDASDVAVYGDDIIVRQGAYHRTMHMLEDFGFQVNVSKSFATGPFRESCGFDWYNGHYVRPVYLKTLTGLKDLVVTHNRLRYWAFVVLGSPGFISGTLRYIRSLVSPHFLAVGPENMLDFGSWFHIDPNDDASERSSPAYRFRYRWSARASTPWNWEFGRLLASHKETPRVISHEHGASLEHLAHKSKQAELNLPPSPSAGSVYSVLDRASYQKRVKLSRVRRHRQVAVYAYEDPRLLLNSLYGS